jgi:hypothetical protein
MTKRLVAFTLVYCLFTGQVLAAISAAMVWEVQTGGNDTNNSGGFRGGAYIAAPSTPSVSNITTGGSVAANTYYFVYTHTDGLGETVISAQSSTVTTGTTSTITATSPGASTGALTWSCYVGTANGGPYFPQGTGLTIGSNRVITTTPPTSGAQPRGVDYSQSTSVQLAINNTTVTATTTGANSNTLTFTAGHTPVGAEVGNTVRILSGGTNINAGDYEITAVTTTTWTVTGAQNLTTAGGAGSNITGNLGGCLASPGQACAFAVSSNTVYIKAGTYTIGTGTNNTAGNKFTATAWSVVGYTSNRNTLNTDTPPALNAGGASMVVMTIAGNQAYVNNVSITNSGVNASVTGWQPPNGTFMARLVSVTGCAVSVASGGSSNVLIDCSDSGCSGMGAFGNGNTLIRYVSSGATGSSNTAINLGSACQLREGIVTGQSGTNSIGVKAGGSCLISNCVVDGNAGSTTIGINLNGSGSVAENCIVSNYSGTSAIGYSEPAATITDVTNRWQNCADYGNTLAYSTSILAYQKINCVTLSASPYVNSGSNNFALNTTAGGGAACRAAGIPGTWPLLSTTGYRDIGAVQHADPTGGGFIPNPMMLRSPLPALRRKAG